MEKLRCGGLKKFIVIKEEDTEKYLNPFMQNMIGIILGKIYEGRKRDKRQPENEYIVINTDELYADEVIEILRKNGHWEWWNHN
jgi:hypothetical protein